MPTLATLWPVRGSGSADVALIVVMVVVLLAAAPVAWFVARRQFGAAVGPIWPILAFVVAATAYAVATPPWQTPDEPQHMVHVEVVRRAGLSAPSELLPGATPSPAATAALTATDQDVVSSMRATDATKWLPGAQSALDAGTVPGPREFSHPRLFYAAAAGLTAPLGGADILGRLAVLRALGILFAAVVVWCCGAAGRMLWPDHRLAEAPIALVVAIPTFVAFAGSVNNDGLASLCGAALITVLLAGVLERGRIARPVPWAIAIAIVMIAGVSTKRTFLPLAALVVVAVAIRLRRQWTSVLMGVVATVLVTAAAFAAGWAPRLALWQQQSSDIAYRCRDDASARRAICLPGGAPSIRQNIPLVRVDKLEGQPIELALTVRSTTPDQPFSIDVISNTGTVVGRRFPVGTTRVPVSLRAIAPDDLEGLWVEMSAPRGSGTVLVQDVRLSNASVVGTGSPVAPSNELENPSGELAVAGAPTFLPESLRRQINSAIDAVDKLVHEADALVESIPIIWDRMATTFSMFWATVGWQLPPPLLPVGLNWVLAVLTVIAVCGAAAALLRTRLSVFAGGLLLFSTLLVTVAVAFRNLPPDEPGIVNGRYLYPGLVAFVVVLAAGWGHLYPGPDADFRILTRFAVPVMQGLFVALVFIPWLLK